MMRLEDTEFMHVTIDGLGGFAVTDSERVLRFLKSTARQLDMTPVGDPLIKQFPPRSGHTDSGITGLQIIAESHIAIHTFPEADGLVCIDLFSCKRFDDQRFIAFAHHYWGFSTLHLNSVNRQEIVERWKNQQVIR